MTFGSQGNQNSPQQGRRSAVVLANDEARKLNHHHIDTSHLLLGLLREGRGVAATALAGLGIGYDAVVSRVIEIAGRGAEPTPSHVPFTPEGKQAMEDSLEESLALRHEYIGPEHILLGLIQNENDATRIIADLGVEPQQVRERVLAALE